MQGRTLKKKVLKFYDDLKERIGDRPGSLMLQELASWMPYIAQLRSRCYMRVPKSYGSILKLTRSIFQLQWQRLPQR